MGQEGGEAKIASGWPPTFDGLSRHSLTPGSPMTRIARKRLSRSNLPRARSSRRRSVPPSPPQPVSQSVNQRWRERPRCPALRVAPALGDGVVHAIAGRAACHCLRSRVSSGRTRRPRASVRGPVSPDNPRRQIARTLARCAATFFRKRSDGSPYQSVRLHHRAFDSRAVLGVVNALRCASTRPRAGPAGIDDACARHDLGYCAMAGFLMARVGTEKSES